MELLAQVVIQGKSGLPADRFVNSFAIRTDVNITDANKGEVTMPVASFYNFVASSGLSVASYLSSWVDRSAGATKIKLYDVTGKLAGQPHGSPIAEDQTSLNAEAAGANTNLPEEVAATLTFRVADHLNLPFQAPDDADADSAPERPRARGTNRVYLGPLNSALLVEETSGRAQISAGFRTTALEAAEHLQDQLAVSGHEHCVWSREAGVMLRVVRAEIDDAFDSQRRRGSAPTVRQSRVYS